MISLGIKRLWMIGLLILVLLAGCASNTPEFQLPSEREENLKAEQKERPKGPLGTRHASSFMPLNLGNSWVYRKSFLGETGEVKVTIEKKDDEGFWMDNQGGKLKVTAFGLRDKDRYLLLHPLETGNRWRSQVGLGVAEHFEIISDNSHMTVPAGSFEHCVVVRSVTTLSDSVRMTNTLVYAPKVGLIRTETKMENNKKRVSRQVLMELISYELP